MNGLLSLSSLLPFLVLPLVLLLLAQLLSRRATSSAKKAKLPPSPSGLPLIGNLHQLGSLPHRSLRAMSARHGPLMLLRLGQVRALVVSSAAMAREVMKNQDHVFASRPSLTVPNMLLRDGRDVAFAPYGDHWRQMKKVSLLHLLNAEMVRSFRHIREKEVASMVEDIAGAAAHGRPIDMTRVLNSLAKRVIGQATLGKSSTIETVWGSYVDGILEEVTSALGTFHVGDCFPSLRWLSKMMISGRLKNVVKRMDAILDQIIEENKKNAAGEVERREDFMGVLLSLQEEAEMKRFMTRDVIRAVVTEMHGAGLDTTYIVIEWTMTGAGDEHFAFCHNEWTMTELIRNPHAMKELRHEVQRIVGSKLVISEEDLTQMNYLHAVIKEAMRLHPPGPLLVPRKSLYDTTVEGYDVPKGTMTLINAWAIGRDPTFWGESAEEFRPERFLNNDIDFRGFHFELIPFGAGRRICPGIGFAIALVELGLATLVHRFEWELPEGMEMDMDEVFGITMHKKSGLQLVATPCL